MPARTAGVILAKRNTPFSPNEINALCRDARSTVPFRSAGFCPRARNPYPAVDVMHTQELWNRSPDHGTAALRPRSPRSAFRLCTAAPDVISLRPGCKCGGEFATARLASTTQNDDRFDAIPSQKNFPVPAKNFPVFGGTGKRLQVADSVWRPDRSAAPRDRKRMKFSKFPVNFPVIREFIAPATEALRRCALIPPRLRGGWREAPGGATTGTAGP